MAKQSILGDHFVNLVGRAPFSSRRQSESEIIEELSSILKEDPRLVDSILRTDDTSSALQLAIRNDLFDVAHKLIEWGANINYRNASLRSPAFDAVTAGRFDLLKIMHERGARLAQRASTGYNMLHCAASSDDEACFDGHLACMKFLLEQGVSPLIRNMDGDYPLHMAAKSNFAQAVELLGEKSGPTILCLATAHGGKSALHLAALGATKADLSNPGAHNEARVQATVRQLLILGADPLQVDWQDRTSIHAAAQAGYVSVFQLLVQAGADPNARDCAEATPLHLAINEKRPGSVLIGLIHSGASLELTDAHGVTAEKKLLRAKHPDAKAVLAFAAAHRAKDAMSSTSLTAPRPL